MWGIFMVKVLGDGSNKYSLEVEDRSEICNSNMNGGVYYMAYLHAYLLANFLYTW